MDLEFRQFRNQPASISDHFLELGAYRFPFDEILNFGNSIGKVSVRSIVQAVEDYSKITHGECQPQLAMLTFTATANQRALDLYFPMSQTLSEQEIQHFYQFVDSIVKHPHFDVQLLGEDRAKLTTVMPFGIRYLIAGHIAEVFLQRRDIAERFLASPRHFQLYVTSRAFRQDGGVAGGDYNPQRESIQLVLARLFEGFFGTTAGVSPFLHEFGHMLDHFEAGSGRMGSAKGLLPGLSPTDGIIFSSRARELFIAGKRLEIERYNARYRGIAQQTDSLPIGHPYVFQNDGEFIAGYLEMFFRNPNYFASQNQDLYLSFVEIFKSDPRNAWVEDFSFYVNENRNFYRSGQQPWAPHLSVPSD